MKEKIKLYLYSAFILIFSVWAILFIWIHQPLNKIFTVACILFVITLALACIYAYFKKTKLNFYLSNIYIVLALCLVTHFFLLEPRNDREWQDESDKIIQFKFVDGKVEVENVRNFIWHSAKDYEIQWETRRYDLEQIESVDLVVSYFMRGPVAHVFVTFGFKNGEHLAFSLEVRQESHESFSTIGGFFRQYELALVVGDENDLIYTRSNVRDEDVHIYPIQMKHTEMQMLFLEFLNKANRLNNHPAWYNTLTSNCTTILFDLMEHATGDIPKDYRILLPGLIPRYLYETEQLDQQYSFKEWQKHSFINPKIAHIDDIRKISSQKFSKMIRQNKDH